MPQSLVLTGCISFPRVGGAVIFSTELEAIHDRVENLGQKKTIDGNELRFENVCDRKALCGTEVEAVSEFGFRRLDDFSDSDSRSEEESKYTRPSNQAYCVEI